MKTLLLYRFSIEQLEAWKLLLVPIQKGNIQPTHLFENFKQYDLRNETVSEETYLPLFSLVVRNYGLGPFTSGLWH